MAEAIRLDVEEGYSVKGAAMLKNSRKLHAVPRVTLHDRLKKPEPMKPVLVGRPTELPVEVEKALVKCLKLCGEFQYPMRKSDLKQLVQNYCTEHNVDTRWKENKRGGSGSTTF